LISGSSFKSNKLLWQPGEAWIEVYWTRTPASSVVRVGNAFIGFPPAEERVAALPVVPSLPVDLTAGPFTIFFPIPPPGAFDHWTVHLGAIQVGNETVQLPDYKSCFFSGGFRFDPVD
jgi:hypothetical protein